MRILESRRSSGKINIADKIKNSESTLAMELQFRFRRPCRDQQRLAHAMITPRYVREHTIVPVDILGCLNTIVHIVLAINEVETWYSQSGYDMMR